MESTEPSVTGDLTTVPVESTVVSTSVTSVTRGGTTESIETAVTMIGTTDVPESTEDSTETSAS